MEVMPNAIQLMAKATQDAGLSLNGTVGEMMDLQKQGLLVSSKVLPFFALRMQEAAQANGGLESALNSNRVAMNRFMFSVQEASNTIFQTGLAEGLTDFFNTISKSTVDLAPLWRALGKIGGSIFKGLAKIVEAVTPTFIAIGNVLDTITDAMGDMSAAAMILMSPTGWAGIFSPAAREGVGLLGKAFVRLLGPVGIFLESIQQIAFWMEELLNLFVSQDKVGVLFDPRKDKDAAEALKKRFIGTDEERPSMLSDITQTAGRLNPAAMIGQMIANNMSGLLPNLNSLPSSVTPQQGAYSPYAFPSQAIQVTIPVNIDGEKVAEAVTDTDTLGDAIMSKLAPYLTGAY